MQAGCDCNFYAVGVQRQIASNGVLARCFKLWKAQNVFTEEEALQTSISLHYASV